MARRKAYARYEVTGPGLEDVSYQDPGPALSRALTAALAITSDETFYVRDAVTGEIYGYAERANKLVFCVRRD